jgi:hypothetical protein
LLSEERIALFFRAVGSLLFDVIDFGGENCVMATREQQTAAKKKMDAAEAALENYVNRPPDVDADLTLHRRLAEELRVAMHDFLETLK